MDYGLWIMDYGLWIMDYGLWIMDYGLWIMDYGLWFMVYGLWVLFVLSAATLWNTSTVHSSRTSILDFRFSCIKNTMVLYVNLVDDTNDHGVDRHVFCFGG